MQCEKCLLCISDGVLALVLFFLVHFYVGLAFCIVGIFSVAANHDTGPCLYPIPPFLIVSGTIMFASAFLPPLALINTGPLVWGTYMTFSLYEDFMIRYEKQVPKEIISVDCDVAPYFTSLAGVVLTWSFYFYFCFWMLLDCEFGSKFRKFRRSRSRHYKDYES